MQAKNVPLLSGIWKLARHSGSITARKDDYMAVGPDAARHLSTDL